MARHASDRPPASKPEPPPRQISGTFARAPQRAIWSALVDVRHGMLLEALDGLDPEGRLEGLAAAVPELFASKRVAWEQVFRRAKSGELVAELHDVVLVSREYVHVVQRSASDGQTALASVAPRTRNIGLIISEARDRLATAFGAR